MSVKQQFRRQGIVAPQQLAQFRGNQERLAPVNRPEDAGNIVISLQLKVDMLQLALALVGWIRMDLVGIEIVGQGHPHAPGRLIPGGADLKKINVSDFHRTNPQ